MAQIMRTVLYLFPNVIQKLQIGTLGAGVILGALATTAQACQQSDLTALSQAWIARIEPAPFRLIDRDSSQALKLAGIRVVDPQGAQDLIQRLGARGVQLTAGAMLSDRHDQLWVYAWAGDTLINQELVQAGLAVAWPRHGLSECHNTLSASEGQARAKGLGIWAKGWPFRAEPPTALMSLPRGSFVVFEGKILKAERLSKVAYINFGSNYRTDTSARIQRKRLKAFKAAGIEMANLAGRQVRIRGFLSFRGGPMIDLDQPHQLELLD